MVDLHMRRISSPPNSVKYSTLWSESATSFSARCVALAIAASIWGDATKSSLPHLSQPTELVSSRPPVQVTAISSGEKRYFFHTTNKRNPARPCYYPFAYKTQDWYVHGRVLPTGTSARGAFDYQLERFVKEAILQ